MRQGLSTREHGAWRGKEHVLVEDWCQQYPSHTTISRALPEGATVAVSAAADVTDDGGTFAFASWSDGGARAHEIVVPADPLVLTAHYEPVPAPGSG